MQRLLLLLLVACGFSPETPDYVVAANDLSPNCRGLTSCDGSCVNLSQDVANCGACGNACGRAGARCRMSQCQYQIDTTDAISCETLCSAKQLVCVEAVERTGLLPPQDVACDAQPSLGPHSLTCWCGAI